MSPPSKELMRIVLERKLNHGGHPVLRWNFDNVHIRTDPAGNIKPDKEKSMEKIDGVVALVMAMDRAMKNLNGGDSVYETVDFWCWGEEMPSKPKRPCRYPICPDLCASGVYCEDHRKECGHDALRGGANTCGYDARWRKARALFLSQHPLCAECRKNRVLTPATVVDHIVPHRGNAVLFWDIKNWQPLCKDCLDRKTGTGL